MSCKVVPQDRPTFKVVHWYRCQGLCERQSFLDFEKTFVKMVETISNAENDSELWKYVRSLFAFDDYADCIPINAANLSVLFNPVQVFMNSLALDWNRDISIQKREEPFVFTIQVARELVASELNVLPEYLAFQRNGSDPNSVINNGLDFQPGEEVVVWNENHPTISDVAWKIRKERFPNINIVVVDLKGKKDPNEIVEVFENAINTHTKIVCFSEISHLSGMHLPAKRIISAIHSKNSNTHVHLDGAQSWGGLKHNLEEIDCDSFCGGSHKWFLGPKECGILFMKKDRIWNFAPKDIGYNGRMQAPPTLPDTPLPNDASRFEMVGQRNDTNLIGLLYTADLMSLIGFQKIETRIKVLTTYLRSKLITLQNDLEDEFKSRIFKIETPSDPTLFHGIMVIKFNDPEQDEIVKKAEQGKKIKGMKAKECEEDAVSLNMQLYELLYENHKIGVSTKKGRRMRFSPHIYNIKEHMDRLTKAMKLELTRIIRRKDTAC